MFTKYMHLERLGTTEVEGIEVGTVYVFPKLDGTNASIWWEDDQLCAGSRNRKLSVDSDNAGFYNSALENVYLNNLAENHPDYIFYGEWLVPHSLTTYRDDAWRKFYIFDVYNRKTGMYLHYDVMKSILDDYNVDYLAPLAIVKNGNYETFQALLEKNVFLIQEGKGVGEGIVLKNYEWANKFGNVVWAKLITNAFKEVHHKAMGAPIIGPDAVEEKIAEKFVTQHLVDKVYAKLVNDNGGWHSKLIPQLLGVVFYDLIREELWEILKEYKNPKIDFGFLQRLTIARIKRLKPELF
jgi:hypothetical protein